MDTFSRSLPMMLYRALDAVMPRFRALFREVGLTEQQWRILRVLWESDELSSSELAERTLIPPPSLVGILDRLELRYLVARRRNKRDRRGIIVQITPDGQKLKELVTPKVDALYRDFQMSVEPEVWRQLQHGLECICRTGTTANDHVAPANE